MTDEQIDQLRNQINDIDRQLMGVLEKRLKICKQIGKIKRQNNIPIEDKTREEEIIKHKLEMSCLSNDFIKRLFETILKESKKIQGRNE